MAEMKTARVGAARVAILNAGDLRLRLAEEMAVPESEWRPQYAEIFDQPLIFPSLSVYIELEGVRLLVDANDYQATVTPDNPYAIAGYSPPPAIPAQLAGLGAQPEGITHMVITHAHWDHFAGATTATDGGYAPTFPRASYYLGAAEWRDAELQKALQDQASLEARTLGALHARGALRLVEGRERIGEGIEILPAPGETPGHQIVRVHSQGETLYVVGDLFHHAIEVERPEWMVTWADRESMLATRSWLTRDALAERALIVAAHIASPGRIERAGDGMRWHDA
ncbi:MAG TPA: MBL fold metallo-hydrolase [Ktedonobacterales bacterium]|nr:MBL fold metallo-hydrolase [Ktedonobacterales bacterium]